MTETPKDVGASVRARLLRFARDRGEAFQLLLTRYANERLLYRLASSEHGSQFVLKGAALFTVWTGQQHRPTRDVDLLGFGDPSEERIRSTFADVLAVDVDDDGVQFDLSSLHVGPIRAEQEYDGVRVVFTARVTTAKVRLQIDVGFGDALTPEAEEVEFPALLDFPPPRLRAYPRETVVAEKLEAMVKLGQANSRMKDFYDLMVLSQKFSFEGELLVRAISATFARRGTPFPSGLPVALTTEFVDDPTKTTQWKAFLRRSGIEESTSLSEAANAIVRFVEEPLDAGAAEWSFPKNWEPRGPWK